MIRSYVIMALVFIISTLGYIHNKRNRMKHLKLSIMDYLIYSQLRANEVSHEVSCEILVKNI